LEFFFSKIKGCQVIGGIPHHWCEFLLNKKTDCATPTCNILHTETASRRISRDITGKSLPQVGLALLPSGRIF
jgi:hypothetical protein